MRNSWHIARDLLREASARKWFVGLGLFITLVLGTLALSLKLEVVDGALAASRLFGSSVHQSIGPVDVVLRPLYRAIAYVTFYGGLTFAILSCADFAPNLLSPGRIEHLLSLPLRRWELIAGTFVGVLLLSALGAIYGAGGLVLILGVKSGYWTFGPLIAALFAAVAFCSIYAAMLTTALFARSAAVCAAVGGSFFIGGILASHRSSILPMFSEGIGKSLFAAVTLVLPHVASLAEASADYATATPPALRSLVSLLVGTLLFAAGLLAVGVWRFEQRDF